MASVSQVVTLLLVAKILGAEPLAHLGLALAIATVASTVTDGGLAGFALAEAGKYSSVRELLRASSGMARWAILATGLSLSFIIGTLVMGSRLGAACIPLTGAVTAQQVARNFMIGRSRSVRESRVSLLEALVILLGTLLVANILHSTSALILSQAIAYTIGSFYRADAKEIFDGVVVSNPPASVRDTLHFMTLQLSSNLLIRADVLLLGLLDAPLQALAAYQVVGRLYYGAPLPFEAYASVLIGEMASDRETVVERARQRWSAQILAAGVFGFLLLPASVLLLRLAHIEKHLGPIFWTSMTLACAFRLVAYTPGATMTMLGLQKSRARISWNALALDTIGILVLTGLGHFSITGAAVSLAAGEMYLVVRSCRETGLSLRLILGFFPLVATAAYVVTVF